MLNELAIYHFLGATIDGSFQKLYFEPSSEGKVVLSLKAFFFLAGG